VTPFSRTGLPETSPAAESNCVWYGSFEVSSPAVPGEVRLAVRRTLA